MSSGFRKRNRKNQTDQMQADSDRLSLSPLSIEDALRGAMATGKPPEMPKRERPAAKRATGKKREKPDVAE